MINADRYMQVKEIFLAASLRAPAERASYLEEICRGDLELRTEVESLLSHDDSAEKFMETPMLRGGPALNTAEIFATRRLGFDILEKPAPPPRPTRIGTYQVLD